MKNNLRIDFKTIRNEYNNNQLKLYNNKIYLHFINYIQNYNIKNIFVYVSKNNEVDTHQIINYLLEHTQYKALVPKTDFIKVEIKPVCISKFSDLKKSKFGLLEPYPENYSYNFDLIVVPGIVFDKYHYRIGYGKGFYDKFLINYKDVLKIGLAYKFQIIDKIPIDNHDIQLDAIITEEGII